MKTRVSKIRSMPRPVLGILNILAVSAISCQASKVEYPDARAQVTDHVIGYQFDPTWPTRSPQAPWSTVTGLSIDPQDNIWILTQSAVPVQQYSQDGRLLRCWGQGIFKSPHGFDVDLHTNVWITDTELHTVQQFTYNGKLLMSLGTPGEKGCDPKHFNAPADVVVTRTGDIFVADGYTNSRVVHYDPQGGYIGEWGSFGTEPGQFDIVHAIAADSSGRLYVVDRNNCRVQVFDHAGNLLGVWENIMHPWGLCVTHDDNIWVCGASPMRWTQQDKLEGSRGLSPTDQLLVKFDPSGRVLQIWGIPLGDPENVKPGQCNRIHAITCDSHENLYIGDIVGKRTQKFKRIQ